MQQPTSTEAAENIVIVGAGIAGLATALGLHRQGIRSVVLESSPTLRAAGFAFTTWTNAWRALDALGVGDTIRAHHLRGQRLVVKSASSGETATKLNLMAQGRSGMHEIYCVKRNFLLETLEEELPRGTIRYSSKIVSIEEDGNIKLVHLADGSIIRTKVLIGCDGVNSIVAKWLGLKKPSFSGRSATRGLAEFPNGHGFQPEFLQLFGEGFRAGLLPCSEQSLYWFFTWTPSADEKEVEENTSKMREYVLKKLKHAKVPDEVIQVIEVSEMSDVVSSPLRYRSPVSLLYGNITKENVCVAGDAFHPMTPDLGQGGCSALEDSVVLARCLGEAIRGEDKGGKKGEYERIKDGLKKYAENRRWRGIQLIVTAYVIGFIQQSDNAFIGFLREKILSGIMAKTLMKMGDYDCGKL
ncbi:uncharacterized protein LOC109714230 [Ananas comosus]|uniref:Uncharacterized protein LOC109714230 n=1 Tax=Ananas comosus TaxID=4615 RepID=A0A6P5FMJ2_ANACO|nr:uncharacterized protein LOC109714230 [Ananas comosus]